MKLKQSLIGITVSLVMVNCATSSVETRETAIENRMGAHLKTLENLPVTVTIDVESVQNVAGNEIPIPNFDEPIDILRFDTSSSMLTNEDKAGLVEKISILRELSKNQKLDVIGFADPRGSFASNEVLAEDRAQAVRGFLESQGIQKENIRVRSGGILSTENLEDARIVQIRVE